MCVLCVTTSVPVVWWVGPRLLWVSLCGCKCRCGYVLLEIMAYDNHCKLKTKRKQAT